MSWAATPMLLGLLARTAAFVDMGIDENVGSMKCWIVTKGKLASDYFMSGKLATANKDSTIKDRCN